MDVRARKARLTIPSGTHRHLLRGLSALGFDARAVAERYGRARIRLPDERITLDEVSGLWEAALEVIGESGIGLRLGERAVIENYGLYGELLRTSATLGDALLTAARMFGLVASSVRMSFHVQGPRARTTLEPVSPQVHPETMDTGLVSQLTLLRTLVGREFPLLEVTMAREAPRSLAHYQRVFRAPVRFGRSENSIWFDSALLDLPILTADLHLKASLLDKAARRVDTRLQPTKLQQQVCEAIGVELGTGLVSCERVAARLGMHPKALARQLNELDTSYRDLLEHVRREYAERFLVKKELSVARVALMLGYSEKSAFNRAFKRWSGRSPADYRNTL